MHSEDWGFVITVLLGSLYVLVNRALGTGAKVSDRGEKIF